MSYSGFEAQTLYGDSAEWFRHIVGGSFFTLNGLFQPLRSKSSLRLHFIFLFLRNTVVTYSVFWIETMENHMIEVEK